MANRPSQAVPATSSGFAPLGFFSRRVESLRSRRVLRASRRAADAEFLRLPAPSLRLAWRAAELVVPKRRLELARSVRRVVRDADPRYLPSAHPINRVAVRGSADDLLAMADRLADLENPVSPRGILLAERLLTDGSGPLYDRERGAELPGYVHLATAGLELP